MPVINVGEKKEMGGALAKLVKEAFDKTEGKFTVALSGGSVPSVLKGGLADSGMDWTRWHVFFADERMVPLDHKDSNYLACKEALFDSVEIPKDQIYTVETGLEGKEAARKYEEIVKAIAPEGFSLLVLGMGPDGHTCSLFPQHPLLGEKSRLVAEISDSPKPPASRVTLTFPVIEQAKNVVFLCAGIEKADPIRRAIKPASEEKPSATPARMVAETAKNVTWILDDPAASKL
eukprot:TRINITY_DN14692_c0_g1_i1.p1 TRINITY_DN14692_c0_g1~~TRINITY_DN14692_c0_g1_i1.p1  ORF type:complete len:233 (+),score=57.38 TRINITY_DN14692_c0_g1_i1:65-763(+)